MDEYTTAKFNDPALRRKLTRIAAKKLSRINYRNFRYNPADAEDVVQTAYLRMWGAIQKGIYQEVGNFDGYMTTIMENEIKTMLRSGLQGKHTRGPEAVTRPNQYEACLIGEIATDLKVMKQRHPKMYSALQMTLEGNYAGVATREGIPLGTLKSRAHRGQAQLRQKYRMSHYAAGD